MSEHSEREYYSDESERFWQESSRVHAEIRQIVLDVVREYFGDDAEQFVADMDMQLPEEYNMESILNFLYDLDSFFPGAAREILARWQPVATAMRDNATKHLAYLEKQQDYETLRHMEEMEKRRQMSRPALAWMVIKENASDLRDYLRNRRRDNA